MNNSTKIWIIAAAVVGLLVIYFSLFYESEKRYDWKEDYVLEKDRPYGTWLLAELLKEYNDSFRELDSPLDRSLVKEGVNNNYVFIGEEIYLEETSRDSLLSFVSRGNNAFLITVAEPIMLFEKLLEEVDVDSFYSFYQYINSDSLFTTVNSDYVSLNKEVRVPYVYRNKHSSYYWTYLSPLISDPRIENLGSSKAFDYEKNQYSGVNYYKIDHGKGSFYFHTQPISFTNIVLKEDGMLSYANTVFAFLNDGPILWEEHNWRFNKPNPKTWLYKPGFFNKEESPLKFILSNPALKWAWYLFLLFILIFVLFNGKRRRAIIPVLADRRNTSLEHIKRVSVLYKKNENHYIICAKMLENFLGYLQNDLGINTDQNKEKIIEEIAIKRNIEKEYAESIFSTWKYISLSKTARTEVFLKFNKELNAFYERLKQ